MPLLLTPNFDFDNFSPSPAAGPEAGADLLSSSRLSVDGVLRIEEAAGDPMSDATADEEAALPAELVQAPLFLCSHERLIVRALIASGGGVRVVCSALVECSNFFTVAVRQRAVVSSALVLIRQDAPCLINLLEAFFGLWVVILIWMPV